MPLPTLPPAAAWLIPTTPQPIQVARYARNGLVPHAMLESEIASSLNFAAGICGKQLFQYASPIASIPTGSASARDRWRFAAHTSPKLRRLWATLVVARQNHGTSASPVVTLYITNAAGTTTYGSGSITFGASASGATDTPSEYGIFDVDIEGVPADTDIYGRFEDGAEGRLVAASVHEELLKPLQANGFVVPSTVATHAPIYDDRRQSIYELATSVWGGGGAHLLNWTADVQTSPKTTATGTAKNIIDDGTSGSSGFGWTPDLRYCRTQSQATVPAVFKAYAKMSGSTDSGEIWLSSATGGLLATLTVHGTTAQWYSTTVNLPAAYDKLYVEYLNPDAVETMSVYACSAFQDA